MFIEAFLSTLMRKLRGVKKYGFGFVTSSLFDEKDIIITFYFLFNFERKPSSLKLYIF